ncbi:hypothetical protein [Dyadobacter sp. LHD-138]|uniref:hypothetical protein n=1 Tax=Dyadobacter sp. LHD-138 TaxID=3071413 RepID=UPI0027E00C64|nr:hypothetical protein [Dyadobacter sp. LHD-138]MDQ6479822.1 hypothetical protein [Dyadobacter sp. LHD-138]
MEKPYQYAAIITTHLATLFQEENSFSLDMKEITDPENFKAFLHALSSVVPCRMYNEFTGGDKNHLEFNHLANQLCFEYIAKAD